MSYPHLTQVIQVGQEAQVSQRYADQVDPKTHMIRSKSQHYKLLSLAESVHVLIE